MANEKLATKTETATSKHREIAEKIISNQIGAASPAVSPDGTQVAYVVTRVDFKANKYRSQIWLASTDAKQPPRPLTAGEKRDGNPSWSPDGTWLAFTSGRSEKKGETTLHVMPIGSSGEIRTIATMPDGVGSVRWSPNGKLIAFTSRTQDERYTKDDESWMSPRKIETFFTRLNGEDFVFDRPQHIYIVPSDGTAAPRNITPGTHEHSGPSWLADSSGVVTSGALHETWDEDLANDLHLVKLDGAITTLTDQKGVYYAPSVSPDGTRVAFVGSDDPLTSPQNDHVGVLEIKTKKREWVSRALDRTFSPTSGAIAPIWQDDKTLIAYAEDRGTAHVVQVDATGKSAPKWLTTGRKIVKAFNAVAGGAGATIAYVASEVNQLTELFVLTKSGERRLSDLSASLIAASTPQTWEHFTVPCGSSYTGGPSEIDVWMMKPRDFDQSKKYPMLLNVHGGPHTQYGETYFDEAQMQAAAGFVVVMSNPRGSSGREQAWGQAILGRKHPVAPGTGWGDADVKDVLAVLDGALAKYPFIDGKRVGMLGGSYGGYMATMLAGCHSDRFKAICSERAVNNMLSEEWTSDIGTVFRVEHGPNHLEDEAEYVRMSPIRHVRNIDVPMLIIHSENDLRCPINQAEELFMALRLLKKDVTFYRFPGETHELSRSGSPLHRVQRAEIILDFFTSKLNA
ncbi:MAG: S9 family peptidase [Ilumatobacteraceae bacterium]